MRQRCCSGGCGFLCARKVLWRNSSTVADTTRHWKKTARVTLSGDLRESAEIIAEAPCCTTSGNPKPLANFGTVSFSNAMVDGVAIGTLSPTSITMVDNSGKVKACVSALTGNSAFSATWVRGN